MIKKIIEDIHLLENDVFNLLNEKLNKKEYNYIKLEIENDKIIINNLLETLEDLLKVTTCLVILNKDVIINESDFNEIFIHKLLLVQYKNFYLEFINDSLDINNDLNEIGKEDQILLKLRKNKLLNFINNL